MRHLFLGAIVVVPPPSLPFPTAAAYSLSVAVVGRRRGLYSSSSLSLLSLPISSHLCGSGCKKEEEEEETLPPSLRLIHFRLFFPSSPLMRFPLSPFPPPPPEYFKWPRAQKCCWFARRRRRGLVLCKTIHSHALLPPSPFPLPARLCHECSTSGSGGGRERGNSPF